MNVAAFTGLAFLAALNPKLFAVDLILVGNQRPRAMFLCFLIGGAGLAVALGLVDVFLVKQHAINSQGPPSAWLDLALGIPLLAVGALVATGHLHGRRHHATPAVQPAATAPAPAGRAHQWEEKEEQRAKELTHDWTQKLMHKPVYWLAIVVGLVAGTPGGQYLIGMHLVAVGNSPSAVKAALVVAFVLVEFALVIVPLVLLTVRPQGADRSIKGFKGWLTGHSRQIVAAAALIAGSYMTISALVRLLG
jgi:hypothetical protein